MSASGPHNGKGTIGKLLSEDDTLYNDLVEAAASIKNISASIEKGEGTLGKLIKDDELYEEAKLLCTRSARRSTISARRPRSPRSRSVFFGAF